LSGSGHALVAVGRSRRHLGPGLVVLFITTTVQKTGGGNSGTDGGSSNTSTDNSEGSRVNTLANKGIAGLAISAALLALTNSVSVANVVDGALVTVTVTEARLACGNLLHFTTDIVNTGSGLTRIARVTVVTLSTITILARGTLRIGSIRDASSDSAWVAVGVTSGVGVSEPVTLSSRGGAGCARSLLTLVVRVVENTQGCTTLSEDAGVGLVIVGIISAVVAIITKTGTAVAPSVPFVLVGGGVVIFITMSKQVGARDTSIQSLVSGDVGWVDLGGLGGTRGVIDEKVADIVVQVTTVIDDLGTGSSNRERGSVSVSVHKFIFSSLTDASSTVSTGCAGGAGISRSNPVTVRVNLAGVRAHAVRRESALASSSSSSGCNFTTSSRTEVTFIGSLLTTSGTFETVQAKGNRQDSGDNDQCSSRLH